MRCDVEEGTIPSFKKVSKKEKEGTRRGGGNEEEGRMKRGRGSQ